MGGFLSNLKPENSLEVLNASCGPVRGNIYRHDEKIINGYLGIPYAMALAKELRFTKPVAAEKWKEPRDCYKYGPGCPQSGDKISMLLPPGHREFSEEHCLSLNVFTPSWKSEDFKKGFPVMVYFHGGGFEIGFSSNFDDYSLSGTLPLKEVIVVTVNYRVGPLGFFTTGDDVAVGNYGLWDMTLSLHWVQKHINSFGGDPNCVTVFGSSAGAIGASYLALSPHSNKLFHRYMSMSGAAWWDTAIRPKKLEAEICERFAKHHGYSGNDSESLLSWYKDQPVTKFLETTGVETKASGMGHFTPVFDGDFFPKPFDQLQKMAPKLDVLVTVNEYEGLGFLGLYPNRTSDLVVIASVFGPDVVKNPEEVQKKVLDFYMKDVDQKDAKSVDKRLIEFISDSYFNFPALETVRHATRAGNNGYLASFDYYNMDAKDPYADWFPFRAANHNSELKYMLGEGMGKFEPIEEEFKVMDMVQRLVTNFAKYGNPNGKPSEPQTWQKFSFDKPISYYKIDYPKSEMKDNFQNGRLKIYDEINASGEKYQGMLYSIQTETEEEFYYLWTWTYWVRRGIPGPIGWPFIGVFLNSLDENFPGPLQVMEWTKKYGKIFGFTEGLMKTLVISDPDLVQEVFVKQYDNFYGRKRNPIQGNSEKEKRTNLFSAQGFRWKRLRTISSPTFSNNSLRKINSTVEDCALELMRHIEEQTSEGQQIDMLTFYQEFTLDVIGRIAMGQTDSQIFKNPMFPIIKKLFQGSYSRLFLIGGVLPPFLVQIVRQILLKTMKMGSFRKINEITMNAVNSRVKQREEDEKNGIEPGEPQDFIDLFLDAKAGDIEHFGEDNEDFTKSTSYTNRQLTTEEIVGQCTVFLIAGFDTTALSLSYSTYLLATHPEIQRKLQEEIDRECPDPEIKFDQLSKLKYLECVMKETLRLYPLGTFANSRKCMRTTKLGNVEVEAGTMVQVDTWTLQKDPKIWGDDAEEFRPER
ncbi:hypothetical protein GCK72_004783 [Caenorhabditis remanei]|uniref:Carboxylesterase type B domain-containing protein n=1 Tax=Caenorhabditis remanei TaxID=31234 RepID=A0A6A5HEQ6_CAERE|nr:hypothetical protein GCK72_004783 [Caenorhabditis remanei]KAF1764833.1 hypothetical protein GCK72_004783 [Caenorhabditis remanei]